MAFTEVVIGVDAGTSAIKTGVVTLDGRLLALETAPYRLLSTEPGAAEQDGEEWWAALVATLRRALARLEGTVRPIAVAIGGQAPTFIAADARMRPTGPAITWLDQRPNALANQIYARLGEPVPIWGSWPAQAAWFARAYPQAKRTTRWYLGCPDYLAARLTLTPSFCYHVSPAEIAAAELQGSLVAPQVAPGQRLGIVDASAADTGLAIGTPVVTGFVDGVLGVLGSGARHAGEACLNGGTSGTFSAVCEPPIGYTLLGLRVLGGGAVNTSGKALDWFVSQVAPADTDLTTLLQEAATVPPGSEGLLFLPHLAGERSPVRDAQARATWVGLSLNHDRRHLLRAVLEGVAFSFRSLQTTIESAGVSIHNVRSVGGQARSDFWNQIKADVLAHPVLVPEVTDAAVTGAAILATRGIGAFSTDEQAVQNMVRIARQYEPHPRRVAVYDQLFAIYRELYPTLRATSWQLQDTLRQPTGGPALTRQ